MTKYLYLLALIAPGSCCFDNALGGCLAPLLSEFNVERLEDIDDCNIVQFLQSNLDCCADKCRPFESNDQMRQYSFFRAMVRYMGESVCNGVCGVLSTVLLVGFNYHLVMKLLKILTLIGIWFDFVTPFS